MKTASCATIPTLAHVIRFVYEKRPDLAGHGSVARQRSLTSRCHAATVPAVERSRTTPIKEKVLEIVAEKTGYPKDMLDLDLDLEADLGVDTVKQAEMFAAIRAAYNIPRDENLKLRDFPTLAHVIKFARDKRQRVAGTPAATCCCRGNQPRAGAGCTARRARSSPALMRRTEFHAACRCPILRPPLNLCKPTGVTLGPGSRVVIDAGQRWSGEMR